MAKKLTITDILAQKEAAKQKKLAKQSLFVKSLNTEITIEEPTKALILESIDLGDQSDNHLLYNCIIEPNLKENHKDLMAHFGCATPYEIVDCLIKPGEIVEIAQHTMALAGYAIKGSNVKVINDIKN